LTYSALRALWNSKQQSAAAAGAIIIALRRKPTILNPPGV
jgi:hypothetical protein